MVDTLKRIGEKVYFPLVEGSGRVAERWLEDLKYRGLGKGKIGVCRLADGEECGFWITRIY